MEGRMAMGTDTEIAIIRSFTGQWRFLSNFWLTPIPFDDEHSPGIYISAEHAYQAMKTVDPKQREMIANCATPGKAKRMGRSVTIRPDWESIKLKVMLNILRVKFVHGELQDRLVATGRAELVEGNDWGDRFWGVDEFTGKGQNHLGKLLMQVREEYSGRLIKDYEALGG
jgi:ribA/ribD-fused uncharacterized protein